MASTMEKRNQLRIQKLEKKLKKRQQFHENTLKIRDFGANFRIKSAASLQSPGNFCSSHYPNLERNNKVLYKKFGKYPKILITRPIFAAFLIRKFRQNHVELWVEKIFYKCPVCMCVRLSTADRMNMYFCFLNQKANFFNEMHIPNTIN